MKIKLKWSIYKKSHSYIIHYFYIWPMYHTFSTFSTILHLAKFKINAVQLWLDETKEKKNWSPSNTFIPGIIFPRMWFKQVVPCCKLKGLRRQHNQHECRKGKCVEEYVSFQYLLNILVATVICQGNISPCRLCSRYLPVCCIRNQWAPLRTGTAVSGCLL